MPLLAPRGRSFLRISLTGLGGFVERVARKFVHRQRAHLDVHRMSWPDLHRRRPEVGGGSGRGRREQSLIAYEQTIQNAFREVQDALVTVQTSREIEEPVARRVALLEQTLTLANVRYEKVSPIIWMCSTPSGTCSPRNFARRRARRPRALVDLYPCIGRRLDRRGRRMSIAVNKPKVSGRNQSDQPRKCAG